MFRFTTRFKISNFHKYFNELKRYSVQTYTNHYYHDWNKFVTQAKNATFLFHRDFMEYHKDRFQDYSLLILDEKENIKAILPANRIGDAVLSHQGLTYGGILLLEKMKVEESFAIFDAILFFLKENNITTFQVKQIPSFYTKHNTDEYAYYCFQKGGNLVRRDMNLVFPLEYETLLSKSKLKHFRKSEQYNFEIREMTDFSPFWNKVLLPRLAEKHQSKPVHTLAEITFLANKFSKNIKQFDIYYENKIVAGITIFENEKVVKSQYGATTFLGEKLRALDFLYFSLYEKYRNEGKAFFDMGIVTDFSLECGYNPGLLQQKEELGGLVYTQDYYEIDLN